jgi:hypothetical protein
MSYPPGLAGSIGDLRVPPLMAVMAAAAATLSLLSLRNFEGDLAISLPPSCRRRGLLLLFSDWLMTAENRVVLPGADLVVVAVAVAAVARPVVSLSIPALLLLSSFIATIRKKVCVLLAAALK